MPPWIFNFPGVHILREKIDYYRSRTALGIEFPDWKQRAITVTIINRSTRLAENVRVFLTIEDSEFNLGTKNVNIQMEILSGKISNPFKSHLEPSKIERESVCFAERDLQGRNVQYLNIPPKAKRTADLMRADVYRGYLDVASELGFSTHGGQSRALLEPQKCYVGIIIVESNSSAPRDFPVLILPYEERMPLREFGGYSFYKLLRNQDIFFGPLQWEELFYSVDVCIAIRKSLMNTPHPTSEQEFGVYQAKEAGVLAVVQKNGIGERIDSLLDAIELGHLTYEGTENLRRISKDLISYSDRWNEVHKPFDKAQSRSQLNDEIIEYLKNDENWPELALGALAVIKDRVFYGAE